MSAAGEERKGLLNNPIFAGVLVVVAIVMLVIQWKNITGGIPRAGKRPAVQRTAEIPKGAKPSTPETAAPEKIPEEPPAAPELTKGERAKAESEGGGTAAVYTLQELTPPLRDPLAEELVKIEPLMGRSFGEPEIVPPPKVTPSGEAPGPRAEPPVAEAGKPVLPDLQVVMVVAVGRTLGAVIRRPDKEENLVFPGDTIGEETVSQIALDGVILSGDYGTRALRLSGFQFGAISGESGRRSSTTKSGTQAASGGAAK
jgi:hypothetical protein